MCEEATRKIVNAVTGMPKASMKMMLQPIRQQYDAAEGSATSLRYRPQSLKIAAPCLTLCHWLLTFGFSRGQTKTRSTIARTIAAGRITGCDEKKWPISSE